MKMFLVAAALTAALNSSMGWADALVSAFQGASEPVGLVIWGVALFVIAGSLKRRATAAASPVQSREGDRSWIAGMRSHVEDLGHVSRDARLDGAKLPART